MARNSPQVVMLATNYFTLWELMKRRIGEVQRAWEILAERVDRFRPLPENVGELIGQRDISTSQVRTVHQRVFARIRQLAQEQDTYILHRYDVGYPPNLSQVPDAPEILFVQGENLDLLLRPIIAIVGTRKASMEGQRRAFKLAFLLAERGVVVASGLARGIDRAAHEGALSVGGDTIAVLGTPLDRVYPPEHASLQERIRRFGLLVSQFYPGAGVRRHYFPMRNAVMSGLSLGTVVIEASEGSGALIQARQCLNQGRKLFIPRSAVENPNLTWPRSYLKRPGAYEFSSVDELVGVLEREGLLPQERDSREYAHQWNTEVIHLP